MLQTNFGPIPVGGACINKCIEDSIGINTGILQLLVLSRAELYRCTV